MRRPAVLCALLCVTVAVATAGAAATGRYACTPTADGSGWDCATAPPPAPAPSPFPDAAAPAAQIAADAAPVTEPDAELAAADGPWALCTVQSAIADDDAQAALATPDAALATGAALPVEIDAGELISLGPQRYRLSGGVRLRQGAQRLDADELEYDRALGTVEARTGLRYTRPGLALQGERGRLQIDRNQGALDGVQYRLPGRHAQGSAASVQLLGESRALLTQPTYTTCDPGAADWLLAAQRLQLDRVAGTGSARHARLHFKGVPILYTPYLRFPIDDRRQSGFLLPRVGNSGESGFELAAPYYLNIAPHHDATLTPRLLSARGLQLGAEYRYLAAQHSGELFAEWLPDDDRFGATRSLGAIAQRGTYGQHLSFDVNAATVSDPFYFEDLGDGLAIASQTHLERRVDGWLRGDWGYLLARAQDYQTLSGGADVYRVLPQLRLSGAPPRDVAGFVPWLDAELTRFDDPERVDGARLDLWPGVEYPLRGAAWFLTPAASLRHTRYALDQTASETQLSRTTPVASLDGGLVFERGLKDGRWLQTLEPRLFYLYVPQREQDEIPRFDTVPLDFNFAQLFRVNRFSGADRMGDANQLTLAVSSSLYSTDSGRELLSAGLGQIYYFRDREVSLVPGQAADTATSNLVGELTLRLRPQWLLRTGAQWDPEQSRLDRALAQVQYRPGPGRILNLSYRLREDVLEQTDFAALWPITASLSAVARWNYSLDEQIDLETLAGVRYESCCYAVSILWRRYVNDLQGDLNSAVYAELGLKGLTRLGEDIGRVLERGILGYTETD